MRKVADIMTDEVVTVTVRDNIYEVAVKMKENDTGFIPVVEGDKLLGVITDRDLVIRCMAEKRPNSTAVDEIMTRGIKTASREMSVDEAAELMAEQQIRRLPVTEGDRLIGIVSIGDLAVRNIFADNAGEALSEISERVH
ncbi:MAG: CBS domain-containing protein [Paenibacillus macerans]|uniref:CBS domain protein n=1 Tax=Paenibacillus macerans TaxID=44252 RepID=A0A090ZEE1_PAEMA|nr:CBS domain-containing protein [Paenibacillus macerans]KFN09684.1 CBS domain protein [Paenibacillus macerans]MBS5911678.1 CBS domain-containing protein [Paenibacillus macerans]MCY7560319.1 CBS domain-containing protein [Paenibacillus macerans]MDU5949698.1 CBS domain-containing protein [Paenibacillus macerans]MDU7474519.1 CBS domain-containing protein [Paenibacillus macerans]